MEPIESQPAPQTKRHAAPAPEPAASKGEAFKELARSLTVVLLSVLIIRTFVAEATVIPTGSMEKTILIGDHVFLNKLLYGPHLPYTSLRIPPIRTVKHGEIVAFHNPRNPSVLFVKRAIAVGGDLIKIQERKVYLNGKLLDEPYAQYQFSNVLPLRDNFPPKVSEIATLPAAWGLDPAWAREMAQFIEKDGMRVPPGYMFMMGDNRDNSLDSRFWGFVPGEAVVGEPLFVYWSYDAPTQDWTPNNVGDFARAKLSMVWNILGKTRWSRTGKTF
ncbi:MAG: signal peptidase I [Acidobacteria bacterium]|nr:signal peptidase I [Acidobacteriota bacterium]